MANLIAEKPIVSVILPTRNRRRLLRESIESMWKQTLDPAKFEIVVIDNCSDDGTAEMMEELKEASPCVLRYFRMEKNQGCFVSINFGIDAARAEIVASTDSDVWAHPEWLERGIAPFLEDLEISFVAGHIGDKPGQTVRFFSLRNGAPAGENPFYPSGNIFFRRQVFLDLGGYRDTLSFGDVNNSPIGCADSDFVWDMKERGFKYVYRPDVIVYHEVTQVKPLTWLQVLTRMMAVPVLVKRHPQLRKTLHWGLFYFRDNVLFYLALLSLFLVIWLGPWALLGTLPFLVKAAIVPNRLLSVLNLPKTVARVVMLSLRQAVICGSLIYGSIRSRTAVL